MDFFSPWMARIPLLRLFENTSIPLAVLLKLTLGVGLSHLFSVFFERHLVRMLSKRTDSPDKALVVARLGRYVLLALGVFLVLDLAGISFSSLATLGTVFMVGLTFGVQNITQNFVSGLILLLERPFKIGDTVQVAHYTGKVMAVNIRYTLLETPENISVIVPNSQFVSASFVNESHPAGLIRISASVVVRFDTDVILLESLLLQCAREHTRLLSDPAPYVLFLGHATYGLGVELRAWTTEVSTRHVILSELQKQIYLTFKQAEITPATGTPVASPS